MAQSQQTKDQSSTVCSKKSLRSVSRRHSFDGTVLGQVEHFHPYIRQFSDGTDAVQPQSPSFSCGPEMCSPQSGSWVCDNSVQAFYPEVPALTTQTSHFISPDCPPFTSLNHSESSSNPYATVNQCHSSKYSLHNFSPTAIQESSSQSLFPKPIYSYSILIFMALKNSKTGSLPVSEIYSFMTEHFPYFKTAPDGWKNSVRHNLSLNKCFEKVENKNGNSSRKGCLWALNPAKVGKMQEELHKWRRKDPGTVRRSMAKPEDLDRLLGEKPDKVRSLPLYNPTSSRLHTYTTSSCNALEQPRPHCSFSGHYPQSLYSPPSAPHPSHSFSLYSPCRQQPLATHSLNSPVVGKMPLAYSVSLYDGHSGSHRSMQDLFLDGDTDCDIDTLNPSLTDLQLQGNLWEELKEDSAASDPPVVPTLSPCTSLTLESTRDQSSYLQSLVIPTAEGILSRDKVHYEDKDTERLCGLEQYSYLNGRNLGVYSGVESLAGCLSSCTTSISLM